MTVGVTDAPTARVLIPMLASYTQHVLQDGLSSIQGLPPSLLFSVCDNCDTSPRVLLRPEWLCVTGDAYNNEDQRCLPELLQHGKTRMRK